ncbi:MAG TPA: hypothetical protein VEU62_08585 [Bryobacterales bacterium]|nr:hypothetical protein [Bryobacterales bacterium]
MQTRFTTALPRLAAVSLMTLGAALLVAPQAQAATLQGTYSFRMTPAKSFSADAPGDPGGLATAPRQDILRVGVLSADGSGNLKGHTIATTDTNAGQTWMVTFDWTGKYILNADGTGFFSVDTFSNVVCTNMTVAHTGATPHPVAAGGTPAAGNVACPVAGPPVEAHEDYAFVFSTQSGKQIEFIQTDNDGGGAKIFMTGVARTQGAAGDNNGDDKSNGDQGNGNNQGRGNNQNDQ